MNRVQKNTIVLTQHLGTHILKYLSFNYFIKSWDILTPIVTPKSYSKS